MTMKSFLFVSTLLLLFVLVGCSEQGEISEMDTTAIDLENQVRGFATAMSEHDVDKVLSYMAEDIEVITPDDTVYRGKEEYRAYLTDLFSRTPDFNVETTSFFSSGDNICDEWIITGTPTETLAGMVPTDEKSYKIRGSSVSEMTDGMYIRISHYYDNSLLMEQLGLMPEAPKE